MTKELDFVQYSAQTTVQRTKEASSIAVEITKPLAKAITNTAVIFTYHTVVDRPIFQPVMRLIGPAYGRAMRYNTKEVDGNRTNTH